MTLKDALAPLAPLGTVRAHGGRAGWQVTVQAPDGAVIAAGAGETLADAVLAVGTR